MNRFLKDLLIYIPLTILLIVLMISIQPTMVRRLPNDFARHAVITEALADSSINTSIVLFGNSLSMFGVNGHILRQEVSTHPTSYNLSSVGQSIFEGAYFLSSVPSSVKDVFQCVDYITFTLPNTNLQDGKAMSMVLNGYKIDSTTKSILINTNPIFDEANWLVSFKARGNLRSSMHNYLRKYLDNEKFDTNFRDRYFPHIYLTDRHPFYPNLSLNTSYDSLPVVDTIVSLTKRIQSYFKSRNIRYHLVLMPVNPDIYTLDSVKTKNYLNEIRGKLPDLDLIDLSRTLDPSLFYDAIHANKKGAARISHILAKHLDSTVHR